MKKLIFPAALLMLALTSCAGHSEADTRQIQDAHTEAHEMLDAVKASSPAPAPAPADTIR